MPEFHESKRRILIPRPILDRIQNLAGLQQETNGVLFYKPQEAADGYSCPVHSMFVTGVGTAVHVIAQRDKVQIVNKFLENNPEYRFVKWHVHSVGTGQQWHDRFSAGDIDGYERQIEDEPGFIGMMVSPTHVLIHGHGTLSRGRPVRTSVAIVNPADHAQKEAFIAKEIERAHRELGTVATRLTATRKER